MHNFMMSYPSGGVGPDNNDGYGPQHGQRAGSQAQHQSAQSYPMNLNMPYYNPYMQMGIGMGMQPNMMSMPPGMMGMGMSGGINSAADPSSSMMFNPAAGGGGGSVAHGMSMPMPMPLYSQPQHSVISEPDKEMTKKRQKLSLEALNKRRYLL